MTLAFLTLCQAQKSRAKTLAESTRETCPLKKPACTSEIWMCEHGKIEEVKGMFWFDAVSATCLSSRCLIILNHVAVVLKVPGPPKPIGMTGRSVYYALCLKICGLWLRKAIDTFLAASSHPMCSIWRLLSSPCARLRRAELRRWLRAHEKPVRSKNLPALQKSENITRLTCTDLPTTKQTLELLLSSGLRLKKMQAKLALSLNASNHQQVRKDIMNLNGWQGRYIRLDEEGSLLAKRIDALQKKSNRISCQKEREQAGSQIQHLKEELAFRKVVCRCRYLRKHIRQSLSEGALLLPVWNSSQREVARSIPTCFCSVTLVRCCIALMQDKYTVSFKWKDVWARSCSGAVLNMGAWLKGIVLFRYADIPLTHCGGHCGWFMWTSGTIITRKYPTVMMGLVGLCHLFAANPQH